LTEKVKFSEKKQEKEGIGGNQKIMICQNDAYPLRRGLWTQETRKEFILSSFGFGDLHCSSGIKLRNTWESSADVVGLGPEHG